MELKTLNIKFTPQRFEELQGLKGTKTWEEFFLKLIEDKEKIINISKGALKNE
jgi:predicted CopG family antitoxin